MHIFRVWAPKACTVDLEYGEQKTPMRATGSGWWEARLEAVGPGTDYAYSVDGGSPVPDPRSPYQPHGVHARSCIVAPSFSWTDHNWNPRPLSAAVIYELHIGTFT